MSRSAVTVNGAFNFPVSPNFVIAFSLSNVTESVLFKDRYKLFIESVHDAKRKVVSNVGSLATFPKIDSKASSNT